MIRCFLPFATLLVSVQSYSFDTISQTKEELFDNADVIFIGIIENIDSPNYEIKVLESFKGNVKGTIVGEIYENQLAFSIRPEMNQRWLIYGTIIDSVLDTSPYCGSRTFKFPFAHSGQDFYLFPPPKDESQRNPFFQKLIERGFGLNELYYEIITLRQWKLERILKKENQLRNTQITEILDQHGKSEIRLYSIVGVLVILISLIGYKFMRKSN